jgi:hypothetical protein
MLQRALFFRSVRGYPAQKLITAAKPSKMTVPGQKAGLFGPPFYFGRTSPVKLSEICRGAFPTRFSISVAFTP